MGGFSIRWSACAVMLCALATTALGDTIIANDKASNPAYSNNEWNSTTSGGYGFGSWSFSTSGGGYKGFYIGSSAVNTDGKSFAIYANGSSDASASVSRQFNSTLTQNRNFSLDVAASYLNGKRGLNVFSGGTNTVFTFEGSNVDPNNDGYVVKDAGNSGKVADYGYGSSFHIVLSQSTPTGGTWTITRQTGGTILAGHSSGTFSGALTGFRLYEQGISGGDDGGQQNFFANNFTITDTTPELTTTALFGGSLSFVTLLRRRGRSCLATAAA